MTKLEVAPNVIVRTANNEDLPRVNEFYSLTRYKFRPSVDDVVFIAETDGKIVGATRVVTENGDLVLRGMQVHVDYQNHGIGRRLLQAAKDELDRAKESYCLPYRHLELFYTSAGFKRIPSAIAPKFLRERVDSYRNSGLDVILMRRSRA